MLHVDKALSKRVLGQIGSLIRFRIGILGGTSDTRSDLSARILRRAENQEVSQEGSLLAPRRWIACFQNRVRGCEDTRRVVIRDFLFTF